MKSEMNTGLVYALRDVRKGNKKKKGTSFNVMLFPFRSFVHVNPFVN